MEDIAAHMRQMAITAREYRLPPEDCDDLTQYAVELDTIRAERDALAARVERLEGALREIDRIVPNHPVGEIARAALAETQGGGQ